MIKNLFRQLKLDLFKSSTQTQTKITSLAQAWRSYDRADFVTSASLCNEILAQQPDNVEVLLLLGTIAQAQNKLPEAENQYRRGLAIQPDSAKLHNNLGNTLLARDKFNEAEQHYLAALQHDPNLVQAHCNLGIVLSHRNERVAAIAHLHKALEFDPDSFEAVCTLGQILSDAGRFDEAQACLEKALSLKADSVDHYVLLGMALGSQGKYHEALARFRHALSLNPDMTDAYYGMALSLRELGLYEDALSHAKKGLELNPEHANLHFTMGLALLDLGHFDQAGLHLDHAIKIQPDNAEVHTQKAFTSLLAGRFQQGWAEYEHRRRTKTALNRPFNYPEWDGSPLTDKTILIYGEQGLGDEIMFASCIPDILEQAKHCVIECDLRLGPLIQRSFPTVTVHGGGKFDDTSWLAQCPPIDTQVAIGSLPKYYRNNWDNFPQHSGYLKPDAVKVSHWRQRLDDLGAGLKVGISWRGGMVTTRRLLRSMDLSQWLPLLQQGDVHFVSLQYTDCGRELQQLYDTLGITVHHWPEAIKDYDETAALVYALDRVISVCTAVVHLSGALGKSAWVMVPFSPEWRYYKRGDMMPWYPSVKLFRQPTPNDWETVIGQVAQTLKIQTESHALTP